jgi:deoxycytidylate deaminase
VFGIYSSPERRRSLLMKKLSPVTEESVNEIIERDEEYKAPPGERNFGQQTRKTFHLSDFFLEDDGNEDHLRNQIDRVIDLIFGCPFLTPTFEEFAMFQAFSASLRSADLSRQVGAVVAKDGDIISSGANDCPKFGGGLYWPVRDETTWEISDIQGGRDYTLKKDTNAMKKSAIISEVIDGAGLQGEASEALREILTENSLIGDLTEFGRMVHAEMDALLSCSRRGMSCKGATLYVTTFPCHNCAKHIIAAGIEEVVYVEPYPKSKALEFHPDAITVSQSEDGKVKLRPFIGVGPRRFFDLFSMDIG